MFCGMLTPASILQDATRMNVKLARSYLQSLKMSSGTMQEDLYSAYEAARVGGINLFDTAEVRIDLHRLVSCMPRLCCARRRGVTVRRPDSSRAARTLHCKELISWVLRVIDSPSQCVYLLT